MIGVYQGDVSCTMIGCPHKVLLSHRQTVLHHVLQWPMNCRNSWQGTIIERFRTPLAHFSASHLMFVMLDRAVLRITKIQCSWHWTVRPISPCNVLASRRKWPFRASPIPVHYVRGSLLDRHCHSRVSVMRPDVCMRSFRRAEVGDVRSCRSSSVSYRFAVKDRHRRGGSSRPAAGGRRLAYAEPSILVGGPAAVTRSDSKSDSSGPRLTLFLFNRRVDDWLTDQSPIQPFDQSQAAHRARTASTSLCVRRRHRAIRRPSCSRCTLLRRGWRHTAESARRESLHLFLRHDTNRLPERVTYWMRNLKMNRYGVTVIEALTAIRRSVSITCESANLVWLPRPHQLQSCHVVCRIHFRFNSRSSAGYVSC